MKKQNTTVMNDLLNISAILLKDPDGAAVVGVWHSLKAMAGTDPDGCVCLAPGVPLSMQEVADYFRFPPGLVEKTVAWLQKLGKITLSGGFLRFSGGTGKKDGKDLSPEEMAKRLREREQTRQRVARHRELKRENEKAPAQQKAAPAPAESATAKGGPSARATVEYDAGRERSNASVTGNVTGAVTEIVTDGVTVPVTNDVTVPVTDGEAEPVTNDVTVKPESRPVAAVTVPETGRVTPACNAAGTGKRKNQRKGYYYNPYKTDMTSSDMTSVRNPDNVTEYGGFISLQKLAGPFRDFLEAWNGLRLRKCDGLRPDQMKNLAALLKQYKAEGLRKVIDNIAASSFLSGKKTGAGGWVCSLDWMLRPENFVKILSGRYRDWHNARNGSDTAAWQPGERLPFYLPGEGEDGFTAQEQEQALRSLSVPTTPAQLKAARLVKLPGYENREVTA